MDVNAGVDRIGGRAALTRPRFDYVRAPRVGFNWPFAQSMSMNLIVWSIGAVSVVFWGCLVAALLA